MMARTVLGAATVCSVEGVVGGRTRSRRGGSSFVQAGVSDKFSTASQRPIRGSVACASSDVVRSGPKPERDARFVSGPAGSLLLLLLLLRYSGDPERKPPVGVTGYIETAGPS